MPRSTRCRWDGKTNVQCACLSCSALYPFKGLLLIRWRRPTIVATRHHTTATETRCPSRFMPFNTPMLLLPSTTLPTCATALQGLVIHVQRLGLLVRVHLSSWCVFTCPMPPPGIALLQTRGSQPHFPYSSFTEPVFLSCGPAPLRTCLLVCSGLDF